MCVGTGECRARCVRLLRLVSGRHERNVHQSRTPPHHPHRHITHTTTATAIIIPLRRSGERKLSESIRDLDFVPVGGATTAAAAGGGGGGKAGGGRVGLMAILDNGSAAVLDVDKGGAVLCKCALAKGESGEVGGRRAGAR